MYLSITIPVLFFNSFSAVLALNFIYKHYKLSDYPPRLMMIAILIISAFPSSFLSVFVTAINYNMLRYPAACYAFASINQIAQLLSPCLFILTLFVLLILFSGLKTALINKIGYGMIIFIFVILGIIELIILPIYKAVPSLPMEINGKNFERFCSINNKAIRSIFTTSSVLVSSYVLIISACLFIYYKFLKKLSKNDSKYKIFLTFSLFSLVKIIGPIRSFLVVVAGIKINKTINNIIMDVMLAQSGLYAGIYYLVEVYFREEIIEFELEDILRVKNMRSKFKEYLEEKGARFLYTLLCQWERIKGNNNNNARFSVLDQEDLRKDQALSLIEKNLLNESLDFINTDKFYYYYLKLNKLGRIDVDLMIQGDDN